MLLFVNACQYQKNISIDYFSYSLFCKIAPDDHNPLHVFLLNFGSYFIRQSNFLLSTKEINGLCNHRSGFLHETEIQSWNNRRRNHF
jgi:hypothetical protein